MARQAKQLKIHWHQIAVGLLGLALILGTGGTIFFSRHLADLPPVDNLEARLARPTTRILDRDGRVLYEVLDPNSGKQLDLALPNVPAACIQATLATEDSRFYLHPGVDPLAILRAAWQNYQAGGQIVSGGSTLTQQVARNLLLEPVERYERSLVRKLREAWLALQLEWHYSKDELLALYLNQTYYGHFAFGLEAAANNFFGKPAAQLSRAECALLVGLVQYPSGYDPFRYPEVAKARQLTVLRRMAAERYLTAGAVAETAAEPLRYRSRLFDIQAPHFVMYVQDLLVKELGSDRLRDGGLDVVTSLDLPLQRQAEAIVRRRLDQLNCRSEGGEPRAIHGLLCDGTVDPNRRVENAAAVVLDRQSGAVLAMVGSPDYFDERIQGNVNAALSLRQPGSAIKPLTYAAALDPIWNADLGLPPLTPASLLADLPTTFQVRDENGGSVPYVPQNYDRRFHGPVSVRQALATSLNVPAVKVLERIGVDTLKQIAGQAGISSFTGRHGLALTLGGGEVSLLELATAYGMLANQGRRLEPVAIVEVWDTRSGKPILSRREQLAPTDKNTYQVIQPETAYLLFDILSDPVARIPAFGESSMLSLPFPAAAKTGTTTDWRDNWTVGYSTAAVVGAWVGNADNAPMVDVSGIDGAGPIWHDLMRASHPVPPAAWSPPPGIVALTICGPSGLLPTSDCPQLRKELFIRGTEPTRPDDQFQRIAVDGATGLRATAETPPLRVQERVYRVLGPEYAAWREAQNLPQLPPGPWTSGAHEVGTQHHPDRVEALLTTAASPELEIHSPLDTAGEDGSQLLILTSPTSNTAYQVHPGVPRQRQRIPVGGYTVDGRPWPELALMVDGAPLLRATHAQRLDGWWELAPGQHRFWLEGKVSPQDEPVRSPEALVVVE